MCTVCVKCSHFEDEEHIGGDGDDVADGFWAFGHRGSCCKEKVGGMMVVWDS